MEGKEAIIERILSDANEKANSILLEAELRAKKRIDDAKTWVDNYNIAQKEILDKEVKEIVFRRTTVAELDVRKLILKARQEVITMVFEKAYEKLCKLDKNTYLAFIEKLLNENAEQQDKIILSSDGVLTKADLMSLPIFSIKNLTISDVNGDFVGGIMLVGKVCDKDLSFKSIVESKKDDVSAKLAEKLF